MLLVFNKLIYTESFKGIFDDTHLFQFNSPRYGQASSDCGDKFLKSIWNCPNRLTVQMHNKPRSLYHPRMHMCLTSDLCGTINRLLSKLIFLISKVYLFINWIYLVDRDTGNNSFFDRVLLASPGAENLIPICDVKTNELVPRLHCILYHILQIHQIRREYSFSDQAAHFVYNFRARYHDMNSRVEQIDSFLG